MKILAGNLKGMSIKTPAGIRPTEEKVRKSLFDMMAAFVPGAAVLELFAGSAGVGLEAWSRGAESVVFIDNDPCCVSIMRENICAAQKRAGGAQGTPLEVRGMDVVAAIPMLFKEHRTFSFVFIDAPYYGELSKKTLQTLSQYDIVSPESMVVVQAHKKDAIPHETPTLKLYRTKDYRDTALYFFTKT
jgi:16S rRNA (guanine966-N2)-methyltransferase